MRLCLPARMGGGGKAESTPLARASGRAATATRGRLFCFGNERAKPLAFPPHQKRSRQAPRPRRGTKTAPLHGATPTGDVSASRAHDKAVAPKAQRRLSKRARVRRSPGKERGKSASGSAQRRRTLPRVREAVCDHRSPLILQRSVRTALAPCVSSPKAETPKAARWSKPAQTGLRNSARCGLTRRRQSLSHYCPAAGSVASSLSIIART